MANVHRQDPGLDWFNVTPSDTAKLGNVRSLYVGGAGNVVAESFDGSVGTFVCQDGTILPIQAVRVRATGTTATGIVALV